MNQSYKKLDGMIWGVSAILEEIADIINATVICLKSVISCVDYMNK